VLLFGSSLFYLYASRKNAAPAPLPRAVPFGICIAALASALVWLLSFAVELGGPTDVTGTLHGLLLETSMGHVWCLRLAFLLLIVVLCGLRAGPAVVVGPAFILLALEGWTGHSAALGAQGSLVQAVHVASAGAWVGGLLPLALSIRAALRCSDPKTAEAILWRFSRFGMIAVTLLVATGIANTWLLVGWPTPARDYDRVLLIKIALSGLMICLAAYNRWHLLPSLRRSNPPVALRHLSVTVVLEQIVGAAILLDVSALGLMDPHG
jgi:putative copper resistance protein D